MFTLVGIKNQKRKFSFSGEKGDHGVKKERTATKWAKRKEMQLLILKAKWTKV
jgi:hypothetical protein